MKVIFIGCGYLGMNLSAQLREAATVQTIGLPGPYAPYCADFLAVDAFDERDLDRVDFRDAVVVDTISLLPNNAKAMMRTPCCSTSDSGTLFCYNS